MSAQRIQGIIERSGETVTLRRLPATDVTVKASIREYIAKDLAGNIIQGTAAVIISDKEITAGGWPGPPQPTDRLIRGSRHLSVVSVETRNWQEDAAFHVLQVRG